MSVNGRDVRFDRELQLEAYQFSSVDQSFPNHFHEYYVIGLIEAGDRCLSVKNEIFHIGSNDMILFNPRDNHACEQIEGSYLNYRCFNIDIKTMVSISKEVLGHGGRPYFREAVLYQADEGSLFRQLHELVMAQETGLQKEELFFLFMQQLLGEHASLSESEVQEERREVEKVCKYLDQHYGEKVSLDKLSDIAGLNKYTLLREFTRWKGITPYRYLETVRISRAKKMLEQDVKLVDVAQETGFADQSHFTSFFNRLIGLTPRQYQSIFNRSGDRDEE